MKERQINLTDQRLECYDPEFVDDCRVSFLWDCWFDVDAYFGTNTLEDDQTWVNFYTTYDVTKDKIFGEYTVDYPDAAENYIWELTEDEESFLRKKMEEYVKMDLKSYVLGGA